MTQHRKLINRVKLARLLLLASILYVIGFYFIGSAIKPGYSQIANFISEYNATGTPWAQTLTYAGFAATTAILTAFLVTVWPLLKVSGASRLGAWLLWSLPASYFLSVIAPCDAGCPLEGSTSQIAHNLLAIVTYFGMGAGIFLISMASFFSKFKLRRGFLLVTGMAYPVVYLLMVQPELSSWAGLLQRILDVAMAISLILIVWTLVPSDRQDKQGHALDEYHRPSRWDKLRLYITLKTRCFGMIAMSHCRRCSNERQVNTYSPHRKALRTHLQVMW